MTPSRPHPNGTHRQRLAVIGFVPVVVALCLTFGAVRSSAAPGSPQEQVRVAWTRLKDAWAARSPSAICGMLTASARGDWVATILGAQSTRSCKWEAAEMLKPGGVASKQARARLLSVAVRGNKAATLDTASPSTCPAPCLAYPGPWEYWVRTGKATWKVSGLPESYV
jgi:hypothetical protein